MKEINFEHIYQAGHVVYETDLYEHIHFPKMLLMYDNNLIKFKRMPTVKEFMKAAEYLRVYHVKNGQKHVKFTFPENEKLPLDLLNNLDDACYAVGFLELYVIKPEQFPKVDENSHITIQSLSSENLEAFMKLQYEFDLEFGVEFAEQKRKLHEDHFKNENFCQLIAYYNDIPAGSVDVILMDETVEIDSLSVLDSFQKRGLGQDYKSILWIISLISSLF
ncbi:DUF5613 domain-containing protein [Bacillus sp. Bva_UNVM-123]|uniref:DUF5613 domain-containing protein n=1 Tax=Bacillus sp. Bva_UNVM-123 TaxID=2829798 RepID=UPI00391FBF10